MKLPIEISDEAVKWVDEKMAHLDLKEMIAQLIHIPAWSAGEMLNSEEVRSNIEKFGIGGITFFQGTVKSHSKLIKEFQELSDIPLMISMDAEWGLGMRIDEIDPYPYSMTMSAADDPILTEEQGRHVGRQLQKMGIHVNFAPVLDINTSLDNPVISFRAFGDDKVQVARHAIAYTKGLQNERVLACGKHFPGHGGTSTDSHLELPLLDRSISELRDVELYPFKELIDHKIGSIMTAHLNIPQIEPEPGRPSSISKNVIQELLINELGFKGLIFTDALDMKAIADSYPIEEAVVQAFLAGNDIFVFIKEVEAVINGILKAVDQVVISEDEIVNKCRKQLYYKAWMGLNKFRENNTEDRLAINNEIGNYSDRVFRKAVTCAQGDCSYASLFTSENSAYISLYADGNNIKYKGMEHHSLNKKMVDDDEFDLDNEIIAMAKHPMKNFTLNSEALARDPNVIDQFTSFDNVLIAIKNVGLRAPGNFGISEELQGFFETLVKRVSVHLVFFGGPYALAALNGGGLAKSILITYQENAYTYKSTIRILRGEEQPSGKLPVNLTDHLISPK